MQRPNNWQTLLTFGVVGAVAAMVHLAVVALLVERLQVNPKLANIGGFMAAFLFSFLGHFYFTFRHQTKNLVPSVGRFFIIAVGGFAINQAAYVSLLKIIDPTLYLYALFFVLLVVAAATFVAAKLWGFNS